MNSHLPGHVLVVQEEEWRGVIPDGVGDCQHSRRLVWSVLELRFK